MKETYWGIREKRRLRPDNYGCISIMYFPFLKNFSIKKKMKMIKVTEFSLSLHLNS